MDFEECAKKSYERVDELCKIVTSVGDEETQLERFFELLVTLTAMDARGFAARQGVRQWLRAVGYPLN